MHIVLFFRLLHLDPEQNMQKQETNSYSAPTVNDLKVRRLHSFLFRSLLGPGALKEGVYISNFRQRCAFISKAFILHFYVKIV